MQKDDDLVLFELLSRAKYANKIVEDIETAIGGYIRGAGTSIESLTAKYTSTYVPPLISP